MTKRYSVLQKKLEEVESQLKEVIFLSPESPIYDLYAKDIDQRLDFLKNLLSAEVASSPENPHHLDHIGKRLKEIETAFRSRTTTYDLVDKASNCSCTESCLNEEVDLESWEVKENGEVGREGKGVWIWGIMGLGAAGGVLIGMGLTGFLMLNLCECFSCAHTTNLGFTPT